MKIHGLVQAALGSLVLGLPILGGVIVAGVANANGDASQVETYSSKADGPSSASTCQVSHSGTRWDIVCGDNAVTNVVGAGSGNVIMWTLPARGEEWMFLKQTSEDLAAAILTDAGGMGCKVTRDGVGYFAACGPAASTLAPSP